MSEWLQAGSVDELHEVGSKLIRGIVVFSHENGVYAVENACPHMGFPLNKGTLCDGILTCHWHHARFDVCSGGTLDPWADDVPSHEIRIENNQIYVNPLPKNRRDKASLLRRLREGMEQNISLIIAKSVIALVESGVPETEIAEVGIDFGTTQRAAGWQSGLTILTAMVNVLPKLDYYGRILALFQGLVHVARDTDGTPPRYMLQSLPDSDFPVSRLTAWYRQSVDVRDTDGAERILRAAVAKSSHPTDWSNMMLTAATDHFYLDGGHTFDFHNKAIEALQFVNETLKSQVLTSLIPLFSNPTRSEELQNWQSPVDLVSPLQDAFERLPEVIEAGKRQRETSPSKSNAFHAAAFVEQILSDNPIATVHALTDSLERGVPPEILAQLTALAAAKRIQRFHTQNDFGDWIAVLHTFTHAHAVHKRLLETPTPFVIRGIYHTAMRIYLDRFLNIPAAKNPDWRKNIHDTTTLTSLFELTDKNQRVEDAANWVSAYLHHDGDVPDLMNTFGHLLLREDAEFHSFQMYEAALSEYDLWSDTIKHSHRPYNEDIAQDAKDTLLIALVRYLAAHAPTSRELPHVARIAWRLHRGEKLFEEE
ncbi:Rieske (2Fe-2S) protein [Alicyclobacillus sp. SO9]|uniref:Rieske (2Fe-2S) protein n=1 Tax=Alicyclobacillus sp. SO9 TaxID=2665646 RepID=UPI0018E7F793|nr:Rieske (2Fe-2S) protein [Alicyclobacillus sp. SO9]QQE80099.1 Rieske (2Fe-2S) protein [Alicyclobacillus sp. SO9]